LVRVYEIIDENWWWVKVDDLVGLVPCSYLQEAEITTQAPVTVRAPTPSSASAVSTNSGSAAQQKDMLMSALGGLGFQKSPSAPKNINVMIYGPDDIKYYPVTV
jgi:actin cytoskeleton-regulatory complex protein SLA1